jgi:hypothetical protein
MTKEILFFLNQIYAKNIKPQHISETFVHF